MLQAAFVADTILSVKLEPARVIRTISAAVAGGDDDLVRRRLVSTFFRPAHGPVFTVTAALCLRRVRHQYHSVRPGEQAVFRGVWSVLLERWQLTPALD